MYPVVKLLALDLLERCNHLLGVAFEGAAVRIYSDASLDVRKGLGQLRDAGLIGGLLAVLAVYLFLRRFRATMFVAFAIPVSVFFALLGMYIAGFTLNILSMAGLAIAMRDPWPQVDAWLADEPASVRPRLPRQVRRRHAA